MHILFFNVSGVFKSVGTSHFLCPCFDFDANMVEEPVEPSRLIFGVSCNAVH